jgi:site-specific recombinase XerD
MLHSGLRLSEALSLELEDAQVESILVQRANGNRERRVPLNVEARKVLQDWLAVRPPDRSPFVWVAMDGIVKERAVQQVLNRYARAAGLMEFSADVLRHTFARNMVKAGAGLEEISALLGIANLKSMQSYAADPRGQEISECQ